MYITRRTFAALVVAAALAGLAGSGTPMAAQGAAARNEILWDKYGVPHIYGRDAAAHPEAIDPVKEPGTGHDARRDVAGARGPALPSW